MLEALLQCMMLDGEEHAKVSATQRRFKIPGVVQSHPKFPFSYYALPSAFGNKAIIRGEHRENWKPERTRSRRSSAVAMRFLSG